MRQIRFYKPALRFLKTVPAKHGRQILGKIDELARAEDPPPDAKRLAGYPFWRARAGDYRIVYDFSPDTLFVVTIGKRNDDEIYRQVQRMVG
jgi:mRNA interferase RelE/StbE